MCHTKKIDYRNQLFELVSFHVAQAQARASCGHHVEARHLSNAKWHLILGLCSGRYSIVTHIVEVICACAMELEDMDGRKVSCPSSMWA